MTTVGSAGPLSRSFYGASDQGGNVWEWNETAEPDPAHVLRGGSWFFAENDLRSSRQDRSKPWSELTNIGFRVAGPGPPANVPGVSEWGLAAMVLLMLTAGTIALGKRSHPATACRPPIGEPV